MSFEKIAFEKIDTPEKIASERIDFVERIASKMKKVVSNPEKMRFEKKNTAGKAITTLPR